MSGESSVMITFTKQAGYINPNPTPVIPGVSGSANNFLLVGGIVVVVLIVVLLAFHHKKA